MTTIVLEEPPELVDEDPRIAERRRAVELARRHRRRRWFLAVLVVVTVLAGAWLITRTALFDVDELRVTGAVHETADEVVEASGVRPGDQILDVDPDTVAARVAALPWIDGVEVERRLGGVVTIAVSERTPVATVADPLGGRHLVDASGRLLGPADGDTTGLVSLEGVTPGEPGAQVGEADGPLLALAELTPGVRSQLSAIVATDGTLQLRLSGGRTVQMGAPVELEAKVATLATVLGQVDQRNLCMIDVTDSSSARVRRNPC